MKVSKKHLEHWGRFIVFTCIVGSIVGFLSVISDNLPYLGEGVKIPVLVISYLAVMFNSLPMWFIFAMFVGYIFARDVKESVLLGAIYTVTAITFYLVIGYFYADIPVSLSLKEWVVAVVIWHYGSSAVGGILAGWVGFLLKKTPYVLLIVLAGLILQLFLNGTRSWSDIVGIGENVTYCLMIVSIVIYIVIVRRNERKTPAFNLQK